ncbi:hypothetical protein ACE02R_11140 [Shewanella mangrovisoli]
MAHLPWVKAPTLWIRMGILKSAFSSPANISTDIAALKIFIHCCIRAERLKRKTINGPSSEEEVLLSSATYEEISEQCRLSRTLVSRGLAKLRRMNLISKEGSTRKVVHVMRGLELGWCKLPCKDLISVNNQVKPFISISNRYAVERDALKIYLYLLSIRSNSSTSTAVSKETISQKVGVAIHDIAVAISFLKQIYLLEYSEDEGFLLKAKQPFTEESRITKYVVIGAKYLNRSIHYRESVDYEGPFKSI